MAFWGRKNGFLASVNAQKAIFSRNDAGNRWFNGPEAVALGEKMDFVPVVMGDERSHAIIREALSRGRPVCGHVYGREFVAAYAASGVTDTHESIDREIANDFIEAGIWIFLRGGNPATPWNSIVEAIKAVTELGASTKRVCICTDDRDADDLMHFGLDWVAREAVRLGMKREQAWSMGSLHPATRYATDGEIGGLGGGRRADLVLLDDDLEVRNTWYGGELVVSDGKITPLLDQVRAGGMVSPAPHPRPAHHSISGFLARIGEVSLGLVARAYSLLGFFGLICMTIGGLLLRVSRGHAAL